MTIKVTEITRAGLHILEGWDRRFKRFEVAFGWPDPKGEDDRSSKHVILVGGEQEDGRFNVFEEYCGRLSEVLMEAINLKDRYLFSRIWCDGTDPDLMDTVYGTDGLTRYRSFPGTLPSGETDWEEPRPAERWPHFRVERPVAAVCPVPDRVRGSVHGGLDRAVSLIASQKLLVHSRCTETLWVLSQVVPSAVLTHPNMQALIYLAWALETFKERDREDYRGSNSGSGIPYGNRQR